MSLTEELFWDVEMPLVDILTSMEHVGVRCDVRQAQKMELLCYRQLQEYEKYWHAKIPNVSWSSPQQLQILFQQLKLPIQYKMRIAKDKSRKRTVCVDADVLELYRDGYKCQLAGLVLLMRTLKKAADFCHIYDERTGRAHARYKDQRGGRIQALAPDLQNIPEELSGIYPRTIITPDDPVNDVIIHADFEAIEFFLYGYAANDRSILDARLKGIYIYGIFYEELREMGVFGQNAPQFFLPNMPPKKIYRNKDVAPWALLVAKTGPLGMLYGRGVSSLQKGFGIPKLQAERVYNGFHSAHPGIATLHQALLREARVNGYVKNYFGLIRRFPNVDMAKNEILSHPGQSNAACILKTNAMVKVDKGIRDFGGRIILTVHDQIAVSAPRRNALGAIEFITECMEAPLRQMNNFWIPAALKVGSIETSTTGSTNWNDIISVEDWISKYAGQHVRATGTVQVPATGGSVRP